MRAKGPIFKRRYFRIPFDQVVEFNIIKYNTRPVNNLSSKKGLAQGHDLGEDGLSFVSQYKLPIDMVLRVVFDLKDFGQERILARVVRRNQTEAGYLTAVQFLNLNGLRKEKLQNYITGEAKKNYKFLKRL